MAACRLRTNPPRFSGSPFPNTRHARYRLSRPHPFCPHRLMQLALPAQRSFTHSLGRPHPALPRQYESGRSRGITGCSSCSIPAASPPCSTCPPYSNSYGTVASSTAPPPTAARNTPYGSTATAASSWNTSPAKPNWRPAKGKSTAAATAIGGAKRINCTSSTAAPP